MKLGRLGLFLVSGALIAGASLPSFAQAVPDSAQNNTMAYWALNVNDSDYPGDIAESGTPGNRAKSRAQVVAEVLEAREKGLLEFNDANYPRELATDTTNSQPGRTRAEVIAEVKKANAAGLLTFNDAEYPKLDDSASVQATPGSMKNMASGKEELHPTC